MRYASILLVFLVSCNTPAVVSITTGNGDAINYKGSGRIGGRGAFAANLPGGARVAIFDNNENSFREGTRTVRTGLWLAGLQNIVSSAADAVTSVKNTESANALAAEVSQNEVEKAAIAAKLAAKEIEAGAAAAATPTP